MDSGLHCGARADGYGRIAFNRGCNCCGIGTGIALAYDHRDQEDRAKAEPGRQTVPRGAAMDAG